MTGYGGPRLWFPDDTIRAVLYATDRTTSHIFTYYISLQASKLMYEQGRATIVIPINHPACDVVDPNTSNTALADEFLNWSLDVYWRGYRMFSGACSALDIEHDGTRATGKITLHFITWFNWLLGGRLIETSDGSAWYRNTTPWDDIWRDLVSTQCESGSTAAPGEYPASTNRHNFGPFTVTVANSGSGTASNGDFTITCGKPLLDTALEMCHTAPSEDDMLWPIVTEPSAGTFNFDVQVSRATSRAIGTDRSSTIQVSGFRGTLGHFKKRIDHQMLVAVARAAGSGRGAKQRRRYAKDATTYGKVGAREDGVTIPSGRSNHELDNEVYRQLWEQKLGNVESFEMVILEQPDMQYGSDWFEKDTITAYDWVTEETISKMVLGIEASITSPGPPRLKALLGKPPRNSLRETARSGGGSRGGGRSGGGPPKNSEGSPESDPDDFYFFKDIVSDDGSKVEADQANDTLTVGGEDYGGSVLQIKTLGDANNDKVKFQILAPTEMPADVNCSVPATKTDGSIIYLAAHDPTL